jgi:hypothetical protein
MFKNITDIPAVITQTHNLGVRVANYGDGFFRLLVCDSASGWDITGPAYPTKGEAFSNVDRVAQDFYA